jgi:hypothetical protein
MSKRILIQLLAVLTPVGHEPIHETYKPVAMMRLKKVDHFVDQDVLKAMLGFFC